MTKRTEAFWLTGLLLLAFLVRWLPALYPHYWFDEIFTIALTKKSFGGILWLTAADMHPPMYYDWVKCFAEVGSRLGGPFATLAWLRLASLVPGMATCILGWWMARRYWGRRLALWTMGAIAVAPALTYYSVDLRSYSMLHATLLGALYGFLKVTDPRPEARWPGIGLFALCALAAFYTHSLSILYLATFGLIFLIVLARRRESRQELALRGALLASVLAIGCSPWLWLMIPQTALLNDEKWLGWAEWIDLRTTLFWYMPLGPWNVKVLEEPWPWLLMPVLAVALLLLVANAWRNRRLPLPGVEETDPAPRLGEDRLLILAGVMALVPVLISFSLSHFHIAKTFLGNRYNLIPAPFICLALVGLIFRIVNPRHKAMVFGLLIAVRIVCCVLLIRQRADEFDLLDKAARSAPEIMRPGSRLVWNNPDVLPWLGRGSRTRQIGSFKEILEGREHLNSSETLCLLTHLALDVNYSGLLDHSSFLLRELLKRRGTQKHLIEKGAWDGVWCLTAADVPPLAVELKTAQNRIEARRHAIKGGQVVLADEEPFYATHGWRTLQFGPELLPERWTAGTHQHLRWNGPSRPGRYRLRLIMRRPNPVPLRYITLHYRLPGHKVWSMQRASTGRVVIEGEVQVNQPNQRLHLDLKPMWGGQVNLGCDTDEQRPGLVFEALELHPKPGDGERRQEAEARIQNSEARSQKPEVRSQN